MPNPVASHKTNDPTMRKALIEVLCNSHKNDRQTRIVEELGLTHGASRVDIAVVNGVIHGYELKSDLDTLNRLPEQMRIYNSVLDQVTLVVGKDHLHDAIKVIPEWWGVMIAKVINPTEGVSFYTIREPEENPFRDSFSIAQLLWKEEALAILEEMNQATGVRSKPRIKVYERLIAVLDQKTLRDKVRSCLYFRTNWRSGSQQMIYGG